MNTRRERIHARRSEFIMNPFITCALTNLILCYFILCVLISLLLLLLLLYARLTVQKYIGCIRHENRGGVARRWRCTLCLAMLLMYIRTYIF